MKNPTFAKTNNIEISAMESLGSYNMRRQHYHETYEVYLMLEGERNLFLYNRNYLAKKGDIFIIKPYTLHSITSPNPTYYKRYLLNFLPLELMDFSEFYNVQELINKLSSCIISTDSEQLQTIYSYFKNINRFIRKSNAEKSASSYSLAKMGIIQLMDYLCDLSKNPSATILTSTSKAPEHSLAAALTYINTHFNEEISLDFISDYMHMSKSNFCLVFKKEVGDTFINYINSLRIARVHMLIRSTDMPLSSIAEQTGFASVDYMTRTFKKIHGISPSSMRKIYKS